MSGVDIL